MDNCSPSEAVTWEEHSITVWNTKVESNYKETAGGKSILEKKEPNSLKISVLYKAEGWGFIPN